MRKRVNRKFKKFREFKEFKERLPNPLTKIMTEMFHRKAIFPKKMILKSK